MRWYAKGSVLVLFGAGLSMGTPGLAQVFQELYSFTGGADGSGPGGALIQGSDGKFYGTTMSGPGHSDYGTVFNVTPEGAFTTMFAFNGTNGASPKGALLQASDGNFYGTTAYGGSVGRGTMFRITPSGAFTSIGIFASGSHPLGDLVQGPDGSLYGATAYGGDYNSHGTIFKVSTNGWSWDEIFIYLHLFYGDDGLAPSGGLQLASDGNFYGVTAGGGLCNGNGSIYRLTTNGEFTTIASFCQGPGNAVWPTGKLLQASDGNFYGAAGGGVGTVFKCTTSGMLATFDRFMGYDGEDPVGGLIQANDGYLYGTAFDGGDYPNHGAVFRLALGSPCGNPAWEPCGNLSLMFQLGVQNSGLFPYAGLTKGKDGNLYGTTAFGGPYGAGNIFRLIMPGPRLNSERVGQNLVLSWRTNFTGYGLQSSTNLMERTWTDCTNTVSTISGQHLVTNAISGSSRFFRLSRINQP